MATYTGVDMTSGYEESLLSGVGAANGSVPFVKTYPLREAHLEPEYADAGGWIDNPYSVRSVEWDGWFLEGLSYWDMIFGKVLIKPSYHNFGFVVETDYVDVLIWNNTNVSQQLATILETNVQGLYLTGIAEEDTILARKDTTFQVFVTVEGPALIEAEYEFSYPANNVSIILEGERVKVLPVQPMQSGYAESRKWVTDVFRGDIQVEKRQIVLDDEKPIRLVRYPFKSWELEDQSVFESCLRFGSQYNILVPLWFSLMYLTANTDGGATIYCDTTDMELTVGDFVMLRANPACGDGRNYNRAIKIASFTSSSILLETVVEADEFVVGDFVLPLIIASIPSQVTFTTLNKNLSRAVLEFEEI